MKLKYLALFTITSLTTGFTFAGTMEAVCSPGDVTVPCATTAINFGGQALYLRSFYSNNSSSVINIGADTGTRVYEQTNQTLNWGFRFEGSYHFNMGSDINVNWMHWNDNFGEVLNVTSAKLRLPDPNITSARVTENYSMGAVFDAVNGEFGQLVKFGEHQKTRFHADIQYARIVHKFNSISNASGAPAPYTDYNFTKSVTDWHSFNGIGPRLGADMTYDLLNGLAIYGNFGTALLVGKTKYDNNEPYIRTDKLKTTPVHSSFTILVPELEVKLGGTYTYVIPKGNLILDVGYLVINYFSPIHSNNFDLNNGVEYRSSSNFGLNGLYFGAKWVSSI